MRSRRESPLLPYTTANKLPSRVRTKGTSTLKRVFVTTIVVGIFLMLIVGTFNYLGYDESTASSEDIDKGRGRGLAEDIDQQIAQDPASLQPSKSSDSHQDQTHQLQTQGLGHESTPDLDGVDAPDSEASKKVDTGLSADAAAKAVDSVERVHTFKPLTGLHTLAADDIDGAPVNLSVYAGKVLLIVNVASQCGYTESNYKGLKELYAKHKTAGFEILAFPCNSFGNQEPGDQNSIKEFVREKHGIDFPLFSKVEVSGSNAHPLFKFLKENLPQTGGLPDIWEPKWNFSKWLVNKQGLPVKHYDSDFDAAALEQDIAAELLRTSETVTSS